MAAVIRNPPVQSKALHSPPLDEVASVLSGGLKGNFAEVDVRVVPCPDLTKEPFTLACKGLGGSPRLVEVGGVPYLVPLVQRDRLYDLKDVGSWAEVEPAFVIGAGAGPWPYAGVNCEMMVNMEVAAGRVSNHTRIARVDPGDGSCVQEVLPDSETRCALLANLFCAQGTPGQVLQVICKKRTGADDFVSSIRKTLQSFYKDKAVGLGGTFLLKEGKAKQHVMPDFSTVPLNSDADVENWLRFFNMSAPLIAVGTLVSADPGLDLRVQHFHSFSHHGKGGHYHIDTEPDAAHYLGYFAVAEAVCRVDKPQVTHLIGRD
ncbi:ester hydrolase C11orf54 homolog [Bacillus rossius redtenbacheri]|uniref:ester hydrolase C11orf54 homolog n=1 Tax=Bacillus rossius redtenbacheri TaxID=93214 RepID=UPI002FDD1BEE